MSVNLFKVHITQYWLQNAWINAEGKPCPEGTAGAKFVKSRKMPAGPAGAKKGQKKSKKWSGRVPGNRRPVALSENRVAAQEMLAALVKKAERGRVGIVDPFEEPRKRPLAEPLSDYRRKKLEAKGNTPA